MATTKFCLAVVLVSMLLTPCFADPWFWSSDKQEKKDQIAGSSSEKAEVAKNDRSTFGRIEGILGRIFWYGKEYPMSKPIPTKTPSPATTTTTMKDIIIVKTTKSIVNAKDTKLPVNLTESTGGTILVNHTKGTDAFTLHISTDKSQVHRQLGTHPTNDKSGTTVVNDSKITANKTTIKITSDNPTTTTAMPTTTPWIHETMTTIATPEEVTNKEIAKLKYEPRVTTTTSPPMETMKIDVVMTTEQPPPPTNWRTTTTTKIPITTTTATKLPMETELPTTKPLPTQNWQTTATTTETPITTTTATTLPMETELPTTEPLPTQNWQTTTTTTEIPTTTTATKLPMETELPTTEPLPTQNWRTTTTTKIPITTTTATKLPMETELPTTEPLPTQNWITTTTTTEAPTTTTTTEAPVITQEVTMETAAPETDMPCVAGLGKPCKEIVRTSEPKMEPCTTPSKAGPCKKMTGWKGSKEYDSDGSKSSYRFNWQDIKIAEFFRRKYDPTYKGRYRNYYELKYEKKYDPTFRHAYDNYESHDYDQDYRKQPEESESLNVIDGKHCKRIFSKEYVEKYMKICLNLFKDYVHEDYHTKCRKLAKSQRKIYYRKCKHAIRKREDDEDDWVQEPKNKKTESWDWSTYWRYFLPSKNYGKIAEENVQPFMKKKTTK